MQFHNFDDDNHIKRIKSLGTEVISSSNSMLFSEKLINSAEKLSINRHCSLLPKGGGLFSAFRALQNKDKYFGATIHEMVKKVDGGTPLVQYCFPINKDDTVNTLYKKAYLLSYFATD